MESIAENLFNLMTLWKSSNNLRYTLDFNHELLNNIHASIFAPGEYYYFILNFSTLQIEYVHPTVESILGCPADGFSFDQIFQRMHPEDLAVIQNKENAALEFLLKRIPAEKIPYYKSTYTFRVNDGNGGWKHILHQSKAISISPEGKLLFTLAVHTDITYLNVPSDDRISFIGTNGEPSYYALSVNPSNLLQPPAEQVLTAREKEVVQCLAGGLSSKDIALKLHISRHTVDTHRRNLLKRFGANNTLELAAICLKRSLI